MAFIQINKRVVDTKPHFALFESGFRPFFLGAALLSVISITAWMLIYVFHFTLNTSLSITQWHAHEMLYGYTMAVIAGFLLTAISNWTGIQTIQGRKLAFVFLLWILARVLMFWGQPIFLTAAVDILFMLTLLCAVISPIIRGHQRKQLGIATMLTLLTIGNICFYLGAFGIIDRGIEWGLYGGLYVIVSLILTISGRVMPAFIKNKVNYDLHISNPISLVLSNIFLFIIFLINQLFIKEQNILLITSALLFVLNCIRLWHWHNKVIWQDPLLWSLYLSVVSITLGFLLYALSALFLISPLIATHAFTFGGIGLATVGMMTRVILGHTGRDIRTTSPLTLFALLLLVIGTLIRVIFPIFNPSNYLVWILISQILWVSTFIMFLISYS